MRVGLGLGTGGVGGTGGERMRLMGDYFIFFYLIYFYVFLEIDEGRIGIFRNKNGKHSQEKKWSSSSSSSRPRVGRTEWAAVISSRKCSSRPWGRGER